MKKIIAVFMSLILIFAFAACSNQQGDTNTPSQNNGSAFTPHNTNEKNLVVYFSMPDKLMTVLL